MTAIEVVVGLNLVLEHLLVSILVSFKPSLRLKVFLIYYLYVLN